MNRKANQNHWKYVSTHPKRLCTLRTSESTSRSLALMWLVLLLHLFCPFMYFPSPKPFDWEERQLPWSVSGHRETEIRDWEWAQFCPLQAVSCWLPLWDGNVPVPGKAASPSPPQPQRRTQHGKYFYPSAILATCCIFIIFIFSLL